ncbi:fibronectin type III domain protein [Minicystis rosea]|nr:fibronectin type III domain protein [Minicystis rosea]
MIVAASIAIAAGCGYPTFSYGPGTGGQSTASGSTGGMDAASSSSGGAASTSSTDASSSAGGATGSSSSSSAVSSSASSSSSGGPTCSINHLLISEMRTRGPAGDADEFIELYNPTSAPVVLDSSWSVSAIAIGEFVYTTRWVGSGGTIPARGHYLIAASGYTQAPDADDVLAPSITDASAVQLEKGGTAVDILCFYSDFTTQLAIGAYACEGTAIGNPHDGTTATNNDKSLERRPSGKQGHCVDTGQNDTDFFVQSPSTPQSTTSPLTPP